MRKIDKMEKRGRNVNIQKREGSLAMEERKHEVPKHRHRTTGNQPEKKRRQKAEKRQTCKDRDETSKKSEKQRKTNWLWIEDCKQLTRADQAHQQVSPNESTGQRRSDPNAKNEHHLQRERCWTRNEKENKAFNWQCKRSQSTRNQFLRRLGGSFLSSSSSSLPPLT